MLERLHMLRLEKADEESAAWTQDTSELSQDARELLRLVMDRRIPRENSTERTGFNVDVAEVADIKGEPRIGGPRMVDELRYQVDAANIASLPRQEARPLTGPAPGVEHGTDQASGPRSYK